MHIHSNQMNLNSASFYSAAAAEKAAEAQRAAETRKKLLKSAQEVEGGASFEETLMVGQWLDTGHSQSQNEEHPRSSGNGSYWA